MLTALPQSSLVLLSTVGILGLVIGSFLNVLIYRLPLMMQERWQQEYQRGLQHKSLLSPPVAAASAKFNLMQPASHCPHCKHQLTLWENIPLISFILLKGHCRRCQKKIAWRYPCIESLTACLSIITVAQYGLTWTSIAALILTWGLIALAIIDLDHQLLPDEITLPLLWVGLACNIPSFFTDLSNATLGAIAGYLFLWIVYWLFKYMTGKEGIGQGDFKLLAMLGAWLGWQALPGIILFSSLAGTIVGMSLILTKRLKHSTPIPFGPFLAASGWISLNWGKIVTTFYSNYFML